jgi:hypothetical protein
MEKFYMFLRNGALSLAFVFGSYAVTYAQDPGLCGPVIEDFDNTSGSTAGFTGEFMIGTTGSDGYLVKDRVLGTAVYSVTTPTYQLANNATAVGYGFTLGGSQQIARVEVKVLFRSTLNGEIVTVFLGQFVPSYNSTTNEAVVCQGVSLGTLPGFPTGGQYRLRFEFTPITGDGVVGQNITFDDYRTNGTFSQSPLPVTFISFDAKRVNSTVLLTWKIAGEENVDRYEVERSEDGRSFSRIGQIQSHGKDTYTFTDDAPLQTAYYRIRNVDKDGAYKYSTIARITGSKSAIVLRAFPQPVASVLTLQHPAIEGKTLVSITNADGRVVRSIQPSTGSMQTFVDMSSLAKGMYFIRIAGENGQIETLKVLKQ